MTTPATPTTPTTSTAPPSDGNPASPGLASALASEPSNPSNRDHEAWFDSEIGPGIAALAERCKARGMSFLATVEYKPGERASIGHLAPDACLAMQMLLLNMQSGENFDSYVINLKKWAKSNNIPLDQSMIMRKIDS